MGLCRTTEATVALACVLSTGVSAAQSEDDKSVATDQRDQVRALTDEARGAFKSGDFDRAAELLERAILIFPDPILHYNLGRARQSARKIEAAIAAYRKYLESRPDAADRGAVEALLAQLEIELREKPARQTGPTVQRSKTSRASTSEPPPSPEVRAQRTSGAGPWPWLVAGAGAVALGAGTGVWLTARSKHDEAMAEPNVDRAVEAQDEAESRANLATVLLIGGSVVTVSGLLWGLWSSSSSASPERASVSLQVGATHMLVSGRFD